MLFTNIQIEKATGQRVKDLTKPLKNSVPYTSTAARSKKVIKMQNRYARARPVRKGAKVPGVDDESTQVPFFLPSEKPAGSVVLKFKKNDKHRNMLISYYFCARNKIVVTNYDWIFFLVKI